MRRNYSACWYPFINPAGDRIVFGWGGQCFESSWRDGAIHVLHSDQTKVFHIGWHDGAPLVMTQPFGMNGCLILGETYPILNGHPFSGGSGGNSWCIARAADGNRVWWDGVELDSPGGWVARCHGEWMAIVVNEAIRILGPVETWVQSGPVNTIWMSKNGWLGYGKLGQAWVYHPVLTVQPVDITVPGCKETHPVIMDGWAWTVAERQGKTYVMGRPLGSHQVIVRERPTGSQGWLTATKTMTEWIIASCHDHGESVVESIPFDEPLRSWDEIDPTPSVPEFEPLLNPALLGAFFNGSYRYPEQGKTLGFGSNNAKNVFGNCAAVIGECVAAETLDSMTDGQLRYRIIDPGAISHMSIATRWESVAAIYLAVEGVTGDLVEALRRHRQWARYTMDWFRVPRRPVIVYAGADVEALRRLVLDDAETWAGVQLYLTGNQGPDDLRQLQRTAFDTLAPFPVVQLAQAFDRRTGNTPDTATYHGDLSALVPVFYEGARDLGTRHKGTLAFSWKRPGGILSQIEEGRDLDLHDYWMSFARAVPRP